MPYRRVSGHTSVSASNRFIALCLSRMSAKMLYLRFLGVFGAFWFWFGLAWIFFFGPLQICQDKILQNTVGKEWMSNSSEEIHKDT